MTEIYNRIISEAAERLAGAIRQAPDASSIYAFAVFTTAERDGYFHIGADYPAGLKAAEFECVHAPNTASGLWYHVPYSQMKQRLWESCRRVAILPIEGREAAYAAVRFGRDRSI